MTERGFDVVGVREHGLITGYARRLDLQGGLLRDHIITFEKKDLLGEHEPLLAALQKVRERGQAFVTVFGHPGGILTRGDLQKAPVRMWLFGLISLIEMQMLRLIREAYPQEEWTGIIGAGRMEQARKIHQDRQLRNEETNLSDCLQWCDKSALFLKDIRLAELVEGSTKNQREDFFNRLQQLRDDLAHAQDIVKGRWPELADLATSAEQFLERLESCPLAGSGISRGGISPETLRP